MKGPGAYHIDFEHFTCGRLPAFEERRAGIGVAVGGNEGDNVVLSDATFHEKRRLVQRRGGAGFGAVERVSNDGAGIGRSEAQLDVLVVKTVGMRGLDGAQQPAVTRPGIGSAGRGIDQVGPLFVAVGEASVGNAGALFEDGKRVQALSIGAGEDDRFVAGRYFEIGMYRARSRSSVFVGSPDQEVAVGGDAALREGPFEQAVGVVAEAVTAEIEHGVAGVEQFYPILKITVFIRHCGGVGGHDFVDHQAKNRVVLYLPPLVVEHGVGTAHDAEAVGIAAPFAEVPGGGLVGREEVFIHISAGLYIRHGEGVKAVEIGVAQLHGGYAARHGPGGKGADAGAEILAGT